MNILFNIIIFFIVLFFYIHITSQYKKSEDLEIYEFDYVNNKNLQDSCDLKQPMIFKYNEVNNDFYENITMENLLDKSSYDVKVKDINDYYIENNNNVDYVVLPLSSSIQLINTDSKPKFFIENNQEYIEESGFYNDFHENDVFLKPSFTAITKYDIMIGSKNTYTPLRYHTNYRHFLSVNSGKISVKMTSWKSKKYLHEIDDYDNYEFRSPINVWDNNQNQYKNNMEKLKFIEFNVYPGYVLYIPPYWWYSIKFIDDANNLVTTFTYNSIMNCVANTPKYLLYFIQQNNIYKKNLKPIKNIENIENTENNENTNENITKEKTDTL